MSSAEIGDLLLVLWQRWRAASPVRKGAITREQYWILRVLGEHGPMKVKELASTIGCTPGSASVAVKRLEKAGLVLRERSERDERVVTVALEDDGAKKLETWKSEQLASVEQLFDSLNSQERRALLALLGKALAVGSEIPVPKAGDIRGRKS